MLITCVSASNTKHMGDKSTSIITCNLIKEIVQRDYALNTDVNILPLVDYDLKPCILCGNCYGEKQCIYDDAFNNFLYQFIKSDAIFIVVPHYSPIPAKLLILFEKINEIIYSSWINNPSYTFPLAGKPVGIIGHGGMAENNEVLKYYHDKLISPVANTLKSLSFNIVPHSEQYPNGAPFGLKDSNCIRKSEKMIFPEIVQDLVLIEARIRPLIDNLIKQI